MVYVLKYDKMSPAEQALAVGLQGVVNRRRKLVVVDADKYMDYVKDEDRRYVDVYALVAEFGQTFDGIALYTLDSHDAGINMAATLAAAEDVLGVPDVLLDKVCAVCPLEVKYDLRKTEGSNALRQRRVFDAVYDKLNKNGLVHQVVNGENFHIRLRDLSIANRWACIYTGESDEDRQFRKYVLGKLNCNIPVYGWNDDEIAFIKDISEYGDYALPSDWSLNHSYFEASNATLTQRIHGSDDTMPNKHYVALVVSDGDNIQWLERDFSLPTGSFGQRIATSCDYKMSWTFSPSMVKICPDGAECIYRSAKRDYFVSGVSGIGYANALCYPREHLDEFTRQTAEAMKRSDLSVVTLLDNVDNTADEAFVADRLHSYTRFDNIEGGIWELDPDRYGSGRGRIFWSDGKPFVSVRFTMWYPTCRRGDVTKQWLDDLASQVNAMPVAPDREEGYSVVNVHPWTMDQSDVDYFVSKLDRDKIQLVYADELVRTVKKNLGK